MKPRSVVRTSAIVALVLGASCIAGALFGDRIFAEARKPDDGLRTFGQVLSLVEDQYVGNADSKELVENAIQGMLRTLDPHSNYLNPEAFREMRDEQRGSFSGLGIQIAKRGPDKPLTIIAPIDDTPASRAGLQAGDVISKIEGDETIDMTVQEAVRRLKGERGTPVTITIHRPSDGSTFDVTIVRDDIKTESLKVAMMLEPGVGYVQVTNFTTTTTDELDRALGQLKDAGMTRLVLDLRGNPGGLLDQAVQVAERFLPSGKLVVYTRGRIPGSDQDYYAESDVKHSTMPLVVLVDHGSASASEIVSGAIQDHDRGILVGETTFGKGLVQRVIPLRNGGALAVTTAKYYTPSGRLIQRDYSDLDEYFLHRDDSAPADDGAQPPGSDEPEAGADKDRVVHRTASGRRVYGGGGITPDYIVPSRRLPAVVGRLLRDNLLFDFSVRYNAAHPDLKKGFPVDDATWSEFRAFLAERKFDDDPDALTESRDVVARRLRAQISRIHWGVEEETRVLAEGDPQIQKALTVFDEAAALARLGAKGVPGTSHLAENRPGDDQAAEHSPPE